MSEATSVFPAATFVWVYWNGGQNDELRWSIRSVLKNFQGAARVWVVGDKPDWYQGDHIQVKRVGQQHRQAYRDVLNKIHRICTGDEVPESFVWMMDDIYFVHPVTLGELAKHYYHGSQHRRKASRSKIRNGWMELKRESFVAAEDAGLPIYDYCTHLPHVLQKAKFLATWEKFGLGDRVLQWEILYGAMHFREPTPYHGFSRRIKSLEQAKKLAGGTGRKIINNSNGGWTEPLRAYLWNCFPDRSPNESHDPFSPLWKKAYPVVPLATEPESAPELAGKPEPEQVVIHRVTRTKVRRDISVTFAHMHHELHDYHEYFLRCLETAGWNPRVTHDSRNPDLLIGSYYWNFDYPLSDFNAARKVFWSEEPIWKIRKHMFPVQRFRDYDLAIFPGLADHGEEGENVVSFPTWPVVCLDWWKRPLDFQGILDTPEMLCRRDQYEFPKSKPCSFVAFAGFRWRKREVVAIGRMSEIHCCGEILKNHDDPAITSRTGPHRWTGKIEHLKPYRANIAMENKVGHLYCTEKAMQALMVRTVPVVYDKNTTPEIRREAIITHHSSRSTAEHLNDHKLLAEKSAAPVFNDPEDIREKFGPHKMAEWLTGER